MSVASSPGSAAYAARRDTLHRYFDRTAADAWARLTSDAPVGRIRATVRAGRDAMRATLLDWLPADLTGCRVLDAGCGTGALSTLAAGRGAEVVAIDLSDTLLQTARERLPSELAGSVRFETGDMRDASRFGPFDHVVAMDSLIHYPATEIAAVLAAFAPMVRRSMLFTIAPRTPALTVMHAAGRLFPRGDRAPAIEPVSWPRVVACLGTEPALAGWQPGRHAAISTGFYKSHAHELLRRDASR